MKNFANTAYRGEGLALALMYLLIVFSLLVTSQSHGKSLGSGDFEFEHKDGKQQALHLESLFNIRIDGMVATITLEQQFQNDSQQWLNGRYIFPLNEQAAVSFMQMQIGERLITAQIKEKQQAQQIFQQAKIEGKTATLTEQYRPNVFQQSVANIAPQEKIVITLTYTQPVRYRDGVFSLRVPTTMTPRYTPKHQNVSLEAESKAYHGNEKGFISHWFTTKNTQRNFAFITAELNAGLPLATIETLYHDSTITKSANTHTITPSQGLVAMDRDFVLQWQAIATQTPQAAIFTETHEGEQYSLAMIMPPQHKQAISLPKETLFIIDTSGSMKGPSIRQAKASILLALEKLNTGDQFNIYAFNSGFTQLFDHSKPVTHANLMAAKHYINALRASGGTEMLAPLTEAITTPKPSSSVLRQIIFITDGAVSNETELFTLIHQNLDDARLFTVGIGAAPNSYFMRKAAEFGKGSFTHIGDTARVKDQMSDLFNKLRYPQMQNISIDWCGENPAEIWPKNLPDLYAGEPLVFSAKLQADQCSLTLRGNLTGEAWQQTLNIPSSNTHYDSGIAQTWARSKIDALLDEKLNGVPEQTVRKNVLEVALKHHLISPYTSLIAVEETLSRPKTLPVKTLNVPLTPPQGSQLNYPQTSTGLWLLILKSVIAAILLVLMRRRSGQL